jgi:hypothetical protein
MRAFHSRTAVRSIVLAALLSSALLAGCSGKPPQISRVFRQLLLVHDLQANSYTERLSVFVVGSDPDGSDDLSTLYVINDDAEAFWTVDSKSWSSSTAEGETWIGTNGLAMPGGAPLPAGTYRVILQDAGGETAEDSFTLPDEGVDPSKVSYPVASVKAGIIRITGPVTGPEIWIYTKEDRFLMRLPMGQSIQPAVPAGQGAAPAGAGARPTGSGGNTLALKDIAAAYPTLTQGFIFWAYGQDPQRFGLLSGPYSSGSLQAQ